MGRLGADTGRDYKLRLRLGGACRLRLIRLLSAASERDGRSKERRENNYMSHDLAASGAGIRDSIPRDAIWK